ncbi:hypothetical protein NDU88_003720 [Pleurodeles waltl]|uniref:Uncharacterized protein n=1 Tax=Pleurodeles waltl TaxID=8319 RepID=A0AAV7NJ04_PLEWA|nr:hypothetical protein NDU88_003720 [Pleurodeles waltl]
MPTGGEAAPLCPLEAPEFGWRRQILLAADVTPLGGVWAAIGVGHGRPLVNDTRTVNHGVLYDTIQKNALTLSKKSEAAARRVQSVLKVFI